MSWKSHTVAASVFVILYAYSSRATTAAASSSSRGMSSRSAPGLATEYETYTTRSGSVGIMLRSATGSVLANISATQHTNYTAAVESYFAARKLLPGVKTPRALGMLMEEAAGGSCDACKTVVEELAVKMGDMKEELQKKAHSTDAKGELLTPATQQRELLGICRSRRYRRYALHIQKGCFDLMERAAARDLLQGMANLSDTSTKHVPDFKRRFCVEATAMCPARASPKTMGPCQLCAETMQDFRYVLRRTNRDGIVLAGDPMALQRKPSSARARYLDRRHIVLAMQELCEEPALRHHRSVAEELQETCEELTTEFQEVLIQAVQHSTARFGFATCVEKTRYCTAEEYKAVEHTLHSKHFRAHREKRKLPASAIEKNSQFWQLLNDEDKRLYADYNTMYSTSNQTNDDGGGRLARMTPEQREAHLATLTTEEREATEKALHAEQVRAQQRKQDL